MVVSLRMGLGLPRVTAPDSERPGPLNASPGAGNPGRPPVPANRSCSGHDDHECFMVTVPALFVTVQPLATWAKVPVNVPWRMV